MSKESSADAMPGMSMPAPSAAPKNPTQNAMGMNQPAMSPNLTQGKVVSVDTAARMITLDHDDIAPMGMPGMIMTFPVAESIELSDLKPGDNVRFGVVHAQGQMLLNEMEVIQ